MRQGDSAERSRAGCGGARVPDQEVGAPQGAARVCTQHDHVAATCRGCPSTNALRDRLPWTSRGPQGRELSGLIAGSLTSAAVTLGNSQEGEGCCIGDSWEQESLTGWGVGGDCSGMARWTGTSNPNFGGQRLGRAEGRRPNTFGITHGIGGLDTGGSVTMNMYQRLLTPETFHTHHVRALDTCVMYWNCEAHRDL